MNKAAADWVRAYDSEPVVTDESPPPARPFSGVDSALKSSLIAAYCSGEVEFNTTALIFQFQPLEAA